MLYYLGNDDKNKSLQCSIGTQDFPGVLDRLVESLDKGPIDTETGYIFLLRSWSLLKSSSSLKAPQARFCGTNGTK